MGYFDDIRFVSAAHMPGCTAFVDRRFPGTYSLEFCLAGRMTHAVDGRRAVVFDAPTAFWHHPRHQYRYGAVDEDGWDHHYVTMRGRRAKRFVEEGLMPLAPGGYLPVADGRGFAEMFRALIGVVESGDPRRQGDGVVLLERLLMLLQHQPEPGDGAGSHGEAIDAVAEAILDAPTRDVDFRAEAAAAHLSYSHFRRLFRQRTGEAPHDYLLRCRMRYAGRLLRETDWMVKRVAGTCGYEDPAQFSRLFRKKIGLSPQQYRLAIPM